jgi:hypothetical protein
MENAGNTVYEIDPRQRGDPWLRTSITRLRVPKSLSWPMCGCRIKIEFGLRALPNAEGGRRWFGARFRSPLGITQ